MIKSFKNKETGKIFNRTFSRKFPHNIKKNAFRKLRMLNRSQTLNDLRVPPSNRLKALSGNRKGQQCIRINDQWRICFIWKKSEAINVEIVNYH